MKSIIFRGFWKRKFPTFIGCSEIENRGVLEDLIKESNFVNKEYGIIHFDFDKRGIDVALLYQNNISDQRRILIFR
jgi:hypothetical protein